jgi:MFS family permease
MSNFFSDHYLKHSLRAEMTELYMSVAIKNFAFSMIAIFEPIYLYKLYNSISIVFLYYAVAYTIYLFVVPLGAKAAARYGFEHCIFYSIPFAILYFLSLSQIPSYGWLIFVSIPFLIIYKSLFWPAYHTDFAHYSSLGFRGREMSTLSFILSVAVILGPILGGIILTKFGFEVLFVVVSIVSLISTVPLFITREKFKPHSFSYSQAFRRLLKPYKHYKRKDSVAYFGYGEELITVIAWPIFIFIIIKEFFLMGVIASVVIFLILIISLYAGMLSDILDKGRKRIMFILSTVLYAASCFLRPFVASWTGVVFVDFMSKGSKTGINYPLYSFVYGGGDDHRGFLKYTMFYEMSLTAGKMSIAWIAYLISLYFVGFSLWFVIFGLAGLWALLFIFLYKS